MNLAFYYHIEIGVNEIGTLTAPGFFGVFIDSLASRVEKFYLIAHTTDLQEDYIINSTNITLINLGRQKPAWYRHLFSGLLLSNLKYSIRDSDVVLVRSPSPLAPFIPGYIPPSCAVFYYVVGSYLSGADEMEVNSFRSYITRAYLRRNHKLFISVLKGRNVIVNSPEIKKNLRSIAHEIKLIPTTTLTEDDIFWREDTCLSTKINLIYSGRFDWQKGLYELIHAFAELNSRNKNICLNFVGWEDNESSPVERQMRNEIKNLNLEESVVFHGKKKVGADLFEIYRKSDIFILPSYHEGFPRTIWEAQANSLPVISTDVGAIPEILTDRENVILIKPKDIGALVEAADLLINNQDLRKKIISNAFNLSKANTLSNRSLELIEYVKKSI